MAINKTEFQLEDLLGNDGASLFVAQLKGQCAEAGNPTHELSERMDRVETEVAGLERITESGMHFLWGEIQKLHAIIEELKAARTAPEA